MDFWQSLQQQVMESDLVIDRPGGGSHPKFPDLIYPFDYGYLANTSGGDGDGIDVWVSGRSRDVTGVVMTSDLFKRDAEVKLLLGFTLAEMKRIEAFHQVNAQSALLIPRPVQAA